MLKTNVRKDMKYKMSDEYGDVLCEDCGWEIRGIDAKKKAIAHAYENGHVVDVEIIIDFQCDGRKRNDECLVDDELPSTLKPPEKWFRGSKDVLSVSTASTGDQETFT